jgi:hypothetical protein
MRCELRRTAVIAYVWALRILSPLRGGAQLSLRNLESECRAFDLVRLVSSPMSPTSSRWPRVLRGTGLIIHRPLRPFEP